jgi:hypothetical protein
MAVGQTNGGIGAFRVRPASPARPRFADWRRPLCCTVSVLEALDADAGVGLTHGGAAVDAPVGALRRGGAAERSLGVTPVARVAGVSGVGRITGVAGVTHFHRSIHVNAHSRVQVAQLRQAIVVGVAVTAPQRLRIASKGGQSEGEDDGESVH